MAGHVARFSVVDGRNTLSQRDLLKKSLLGVAVVTALAAAALAAYIAAHPYIPEDATVERDIQSIAWGP